MRILSFILLFFSYCSLQASDIIILDDNTREIRVAQYLNYLEDPTGKLVLDDVLKDPVNSQFTSLNMDHVNFGMTESSYWFHFKVQKNTSKKILLRLQSWQDTVLVYIDQGMGNFKVLRSGKKIMEKDLVYKTNMFLLPIEIELGQEVDVYIRVKSTDPLSMPLWLVDHQTLIEEAHILDQVVGVYYGFMLFVVLLNVFLLFIEKKWSYVWYIIYVALMPFMMVGGHGYIVEYLPPDSLILKHTFVLFSIIMMSMLLFSRTFLNTPERLPRWNKVINILLAIFGSSILISFVPGLEFTANSIIFITSSLTVIVAFIVGLLVYLQGHAHARFYVLGWGAFMLGVLVTITGVAGWLDISDTISKSGMIVGTAIEAFFLSIAIIDKISILQKETIRIQEEATATLEAKVKQRTSELAEKNKEITDSITYAKRIQEAILPPHKLMTQHLNDSFVLYKPKDIVAGDFYWLEAVGDLTIFAAADCTGHGVPGAMLSMLCNNALNRSVREYGLKDPGKILDKTREIIIQEFEKSEEHVKDGMDISLCVLNHNKLHFAGAYNVLWIIRKGEIIEYKGDRQPIGNSDDASPFTTHEISLEQGDLFYIFSDGYVDQFGGEKGKKLKSKAFKEILLSVISKPMDEQRNKLDEAFEAWRGPIEQVDDVCLIGVKV